MSASGKEKKSHKILSRFGSRGSSKGSEKSEDSPKHGGSKSSKNSQRDTTTGASGGRPQTSRQTPSGGNSKPREDASLDHSDVPKTTKTKQRSSDSSSSTSSLPSGGPKIDSIFSSSHEGVYKDGYYKTEYRHLKSENDKLLKEIETTKADVSAEMIKFTVTLEAKEVEITNLSKALTNKNSEVLDHEELLKQAKTKNQQLEDEYTKLNDSVATVKEQMTSKYDKLKARYNQVKEDRDKNALLYSEEVANRENAEQLLAIANSDMARLKADNDDFLIVHTENEEVRKRIQMLGETISEKDAKLNEIKQELKTTQANHQQVVKQLEDNLKEQASECERNVKEKDATIEKLRTTSQASIEWSSTKIKETEYLIKQMESEKSDLSSQLEKAKEETESVRKTLEEEHKQVMEQLNEQAKAKDDTIKQLTGKNMTLTSELEATMKDNTKQTLEEERQKAIEQLNANLKEKDELIKQIQDNSRDLMTQLEAAKRETDDIKQSLEREQQTVAQLNVKTDEENDKIKQLEDALEVQKTQLDNLEKTLKESEGTRKALADEEIQQASASEKESDVKMLQEKLRESEERIKQMDVMVKDLTTKYEEALQQMNQQDNSKENDVKQFEKKLRDTEEQIKQMEVTVKEMTAKHEGTLQQMNTGNKEREDRIAELEEFINDQVTELDKMEAALKQTVANEETLKKDFTELNEAMIRKHSQADSLQQICDEKDEKIKELEAGVQKVFEEKKEMSEMNTRLQEELTTNKQQLTSHQEKVKKLSDIKAKEGKSRSTSEDVTHVNTLQQTVKRLTTDNAELRQQMESLNRRNTKLRESTDSLRIMLQKQEGKELLTELAKKDIEIDNLNKQITALQHQNSESHLTTAKESEVVQRNSDPEFQSSVEYHSGHSSSHFQLEEKLRTMESVLQSTKKTMEEERRKHEDEIKLFKDNVQQLEQQLSTQQISQATATAAENADSETIQSLQDDNDRLKEQLEYCTKEYKTLTENYTRIQKDYQELKIQLEAEELKIRDTKQGSEHVTKLQTLLKHKQEELDQITKERDSARAMVCQLNGQQKSANSSEVSADVIQANQNMKLVLDSKDAEVAELKTQVQVLEKQLSSRTLQKRGAAHGDKQSEMLQGALTTPSPEQMTLMSTQKEQEISTLQEKIKLLQEQLRCSHSTGDPGVGSPPTEHVGGEVGASDTDGKRSQIDGSGTGESQGEILKAKVKELTEELNTERNAIEAAKNQLDDAVGKLEQLQNDKRILEQRMITGNKEREDRITELEEFINDQVTELDKMEAALKQTVANKEKVEEDYKILNGYYKTAKNVVEKYEKRFTDQEQMISQQEQSLKQVGEERESLLRSNKNIAQEINRLTDVDKELIVANKNVDHYKLLLEKAEQQIQKHKLELRKAEEELQTKEFLINTYKEDFEQERKDRENAHNIKEDEIKKVRVEMEQFKAQCQEKVHNVQQALDGQIATYKEQADHFNALCTKLTKERDKLYNDLERERREAHTKMDVYKKKTEQFQVQWKKREEVEARLTAVTEELSTQRNLNKQQQVTIDDLMRTKKNIQPQIPTNVSSHQSYDFQHDQRHVSPNNAQFADTPTLTSGHTNAELAFQQHPSQPQQTWGQGSQQPQSYQYQQQHNQLHQRGQMHQSSGSRGHPSQGGKYLPPSATIDSQPSSMQPHHSRYNIAGTNASMQQDKFVADEAHHGHFGERNTGPVSLGSYQARQAAGYGNTNLPPLVPPVRSERPPPVQAKQFVSEGINEEIREQADKQRHQNQQELEFTSHLEYDPYLICPRCKLRFKEGQLPEYRHHIDNCRR